MVRICNHCTYLGDHHHRRLYACGERTHGPNGWTVFASRHEREYQSRYAYTTKHYYSMPISNLHNVPRIMLGKELLLEAFIRGLECGLKGFSETTTPARKCQLIAEAKETNCRIKKGTL